MKKVQIISLVSLAGYIFFIVGFSASSVGKVPSCTTEVQSIFVPFQIAAIFISVAVIGYFVGKE